MALLLKLFSQGPRWHFKVGGGPILIRNFEIFEKICIYLVNPKILGGPWPPWPPTNEATGTEQGQALPSSTKQGQALACSYV